jgi:hypothetical protein
MGELYKDVAPVARWNQQFHFTSKPFLPTPSMGPIVPGSIHEHLAQSISKHAGILWHVNQEVSQFLPKALHTHH